MSPSLELQVQFNAAEPGDGLRHSLPGNVSEDRVMRPAGVSHLHFTAVDVQVGLPPDKMAIDLLLGILYHPGIILTRAHAILNPPPKIEFRRYCKGLYANFIHPLVKKKIL